MNGRSRAIVATALLAGTVLLGAACDVVFQGMNARAGDQWTRTYKLEAGGQVEIVNPNGAIDVTPSADATTVEVVADRRVRAVSEQAARDELKAFKIDEKVSPNSIRLEVPRSPGGGGPFGHTSREVSFRLKVPKTARVTINTRNGEVHVAGMAGITKVDTTNGNIIAEKLAGPVQASTTNGNVKIEVTTITSGGIRLDTTNGEIELKVPADSKASIEAHWVNGGFETRGLNPSGQEERRHYRGTLNGGGPRVELNTTNGGIRISSS